MEKDPYYYFQNIYNIFDTIKISCVDVLFEKIKMDFSNDIPFYFNAIHYFSNQHDFLESDYTEFIEYCFNYLNNFVITENKKNIIINNMLMDSLTNMTFTESCVMLNKDYHFCIDDIADVINENSSYKFAIEQEFKDKKMMCDSFLSCTNEINIDELDW